jgi:biopolymer transport protein ExbB/TolQ
MKKFLLIFGTAIGVLLALGPVWGLLGTMFGMTRAFNVLGSSGPADPHALSAAIGQTLMASALGLAACPIGIALAATCLVFLIRGPKSRRDLPPPPPGASIA